MPIKSTNKKTMKEDSALDVRTRATRMSKEARRAQLLACAIEVYADKGFGGANHAILAEKAQVAVPTTFHYFPTKESLTDAIVEELSRFLIDEFVRKHIATSEIGLLAIKNMLFEFSEAVEIYPTYIQVWLRWCAIVKGPIWQSYQIFLDQTVQVITVLLERGKKDGSVHPNVDIHSTCHIILSCAHSVALLNFGGGSKQEINSVIESLVEGHLNGYRG